MDLLIFFLLIFALFCFIFIGMNARNRRLAINEKIQKTFPYRLVPSEPEYEKVKILFYKRSSQFLLITLIFIPLVLFILGVTYSIFFAFILVLIYYFICVFTTMGIDSYQSHHKIHLLEQLPVAIEILIRKLQMGSAMEPAVQAVAQETKNPVSEAFSTISRNLALHEPLPKIIGKFSLKYPLSAYQLLLMVIKMHEKTGSSPIKSLERVSKIANQHHYLFSKADIALTQSRIALVVMLLAPIVLFTFIYNVKPELITGFINAQIGKMFIVVLAFAYLIGLFIFNRILKVKI